MVEQLPLNNFRQLQALAAPIILFLRIQSSTGLSAGDARAVSETLVRAIPRHPGS